MTRLAWPLSHPVPQHAPAPSVCCHRRRQYCSSRCCRRQRTYFTRCAAGRRSSIAGTRASSTLYIRSGSRQTGITSAGGNGQIGGHGLDGVGNLLGLRTLGRIEPIGRVPLLQRTQPIDMRQGRNHHRHVAVRVALEFGPQFAEETAVGLPRGGSGRTDANARCRSRADDRSSGRSISRGVGDVVARRVQDDGLLAGPRAPARRARPGRSAARRRWRRDTRRTRR